jgi:hypothetical protein
MRTLHPHSHPSPTPTLHLNLHRLSSALSFCCHCYNCCCAASVSASVSVAMSIVGPADQESSHQGQARPPPRGLQGVQCGVRRSAEKVGEGDAQSHESPAALPLHCLLRSLLTCLFLCPALSSPTTTSPLPSPSPHYQCTEDLSRALSTGVGTNLQHFSTMPESFTQVGVMQTWN